MYQMLMVLKKFTIRQLNSQTKPMSAKSKKLISKLKTDTTNQPNKVIKKSYKLMITTSSSFKLQ
jgi:hypothetical protein